MTYYQGNIQVLLMFRDILISLTGSKFPFLHFVPGTSASYARDVHSQTFWRHAVAVPWQATSFDGYPPRHSRGYPRTRHGIPCTRQGLPRACHGLPRAATACHGTPWRPMALAMANSTARPTSIFAARPRVISMAIQGKSPSAYHGLKWTRQGLPRACHGLPRTASHGMSRNALATHGPYHGNLHGTLRGKAHGNLHGNLSSNPR